MKLTVSRKHVNAIYSSNQTFEFTENLIRNAFPNSKFVFTSVRVANVIDPNERLRILRETHNHAHRNAINNFTDAERKWYWPEMKKDFGDFVRTCEICKLEKYERRPTKQPIGSTPIPTNIGEIISMDLFYIDNKTYVTAVDRYSKYLDIFPIQSKLNFQIKLDEIITTTYPMCKTIITDNEAIFTSNASKIILQKHKIIHVTTPVQHSTTNGQVEKTHSTLIEIIRCLSKQNGTSSSEEILNAVKKYNETIHSVTGEKPVDIKNNPNNYPNISKTILAEQKRTLKYQNEKRRNRTFTPNEIIYVKSNRRRKDADAYTKHVVKEDLGNSILTTRNKIFHKDNIRTNQ